jgi:uncharacterized protein YjbI with pentapeptide repeats
MVIGNRLSFEKVSLREANLSNTDLSGSYMPEVNLRYANLSDANLHNAILPDSNLFRADLSDANLENSNLKETNLSYADLSESHLISANLSGSYLGEVNLSEAVASEADFSIANLLDAKLIDAELRRADMRGSLLEEANLTRAGLFDTDLRWSEFHGALLKDNQIDRNTQFGNHYSGKLDGRTTENFDKAAWSLRQIQRLFEENAFPKKAREAKIERKNLRRRENWAKAPIPSPVRHVVAWEKRFVGKLKRGAKSLVSGSEEENKEDKDDAPKIDRPLEVDEKGGFSALVSWSRLATSGFVSRYAESPRRVVGVSLLTIVAFGLLYPFFGGMETSATSSTQYAFYTTTFTVPEQVETFFYNLYFSAVTFTTLGYGDIQPATPATQTLASVQSFLGALLMALLVYVFGRQSTR